MIYGINFNGTEIPPGVKRKFAQYVKITGQMTFDVDSAPGARALKPMKGRLVGVGQSKEEKDAMLITANNEHRRLHVEERQTAGGTWYGIYVY